MNGPTMSAYGHVWPLHVTQLLQARILVQAPVDAGIPAEDQAFQFERNLRTVLPSDIEIQVETVDRYDLSPEDQIEHDRLADEALNAAKAA